MSDGVDFCAVADCDLFGIASAMEFWLDSNARAWLGYLLSCCILRGEAVDAMAFDGCYVVWSRARGLFLLFVSFASHSTSTFSGRAMRAVGNAAELPGWLARVHEVLIDMFDTLFFLHDKLLCK